MLSRTSMAVVVVLGSASVLFASCGGQDDATTAAAAATTGPGGSSASSSMSATTSTGPGGAGGSGAGPSGACPQGIVSDPDVKQALPAAFVDTTLAPPTGMTTQVMAGGDLQAALDAANSGDVIMLEAGATFSGTFTLPNKPWSDYVIVRTSAPDKDLPPPGTRIDPSYASKMAKIVIPADTGPAIATAAGAHHVRFIGIEFTAGTYVHTLLALGSGETNDADIPHHIIVDRCYLHGDATNGTRRGVGLNSKSTAVIDSYFAEFKEAGADSQAIGGWNGPGPFKIVDNHLEGAGENIIFGGATPALANNVPSDIEVCGNHITKPVAWKGQSWTVKNLFELKNAQRVLVAGNILENNWAMAQVGFAVLFTPRGEAGAAPWATVADVTFTRNHIVHTGSGFSISGHDDGGPSGQTSRIVVADNLLEDVDRNTWGGDGRLFQVTTPDLPVLGLKIEHNTGAIAGNAFLVAGDTTAVAQGFIFQNNLVPHGDYGAFGSGKGEGIGALDFYFPSAVFTHNAIFGGGAPMAYPANNMFPMTAADVGFTDFANGDFSLTAKSLLKGAATDGRDIGADIAALDAATKNAGN